MHINLNFTFEDVLYAQSPALFLAAVFFLLGYSLNRRHHRALAVLKLLLAVVCVAGGVALYYLGMLNDHFTIHDFWQVRNPGWVGMAVVTVLAILSAFRSLRRSSARRRAEKEANRAENARRQEIEQIRKEAYASGRADALSADAVPAAAETVSLDAASPTVDEPAPVQEDVPVENQEADA